MKYEVFDDLLPISYVNTIEQAFNQPIPWYYTESASGVGDNYDTSDKNIRDSSQFVHLMVDNNEKQSVLADMVQPILWFLEQRTGIIPRSIERIKSNLQVPTKAEEHHYNPPHIDLAEHDGVSLLYYVNDSDGDTVFFNKTVDEGFHDMEIVRTVTPKKGRAVLFPSNQFHASSCPQRGRRMVINFILRV